MTEQEAVGRIYNMNSEVQLENGATINKRKLRLVITFLRENGFHELAKELEME